MPVHQSYDVNAAEGSAPPPAKKWGLGAWILRLVGFFVFCAIVLILCFAFLGASEHDSTVAGDAERLLNGSTNTSKKKDDYTVNNENREIEEGPLQPGPEKTTMSTTTVDESNGVDRNVDTKKFTSNSNNITPPTTIADRNKGGGSDDRSAKPEPSERKNTSSNTIEQGSNGADHGGKSMKIEPRSRTTTPSSTTSNDIHGDVSKIESRMQGADEENDTALNMDDKKSEDTAHNNGSITPAPGSEKINSTATGVDKSDGADRGTALAPPLPPPGGPASSTTTAETLSSSTTTTTKAPAPAETLSSSTTTTTKAPAPAETLSSSTTTTTKAPAPAETLSSTTTTKAPAPAETLSSSTTTTTKAPAPAETLSSSTTTTTKAPAPAETLSSSTTTTTKAPAPAETLSSSTTTTKKAPAPAETLSSSTTTTKKAPAPAETLSSTTTTKAPAPAETLSSTTTTTTTKAPVVASKLNNLPPPPVDKTASNMGAQVASKMLYYMNHTAEVCEDFYEYACGRFEVADSVSENVLEKQATKRIFDQAKKSDGFGKFKLFRDFHQKCLTYHQDHTKPVKLSFVKTAVAEVGKFYTGKEWLDSKFDLTLLLSNLLRHNSAPLFDVIPDVAVDLQDNCETHEPKPPKFILRVGPPLLRNGFNRNRQQYECDDESRNAMSKANIDLENVYKNYTNCLKKKVPEFLDAVVEALSVSDLGQEDVVTTRFAVDKDVLEAFSQNQRYPTESEIRQAYLTKNYTLMTIAQLQEGVVESFFNWTRLVENLRGSTANFEQPLQVYFPSVITEGLKQLKDWAPDLRMLNNALVGVYAHKLYDELVLPPRDVAQYCDHLATSFMKAHASQLYMASFGSEEISEMSETITNVFKDLKKTFKTSVERASWLKHTEDTDCMKKLEEMTIEIPHGTSPNHKDTEIKEIEAKLVGTFFDDTITLQKHYRESMYRILGESTTSSEQIWTHFAQPYHTMGSVVYELNKIIMPYGAVDWPAVWNAKKISSWQLILATLGTQIAQQMAQHFDPTGMQHFAGKRVKDPPAVLCKDEDARERYQEIVESYEWISSTPQEMVLPSTGQSISYKISDLSLNQRFSDMTGLHLTHETMSHLPEDSKKLLPWLSSYQTDVNKQFFLAYAQSYCTKIPVTSSFVSLHEDEHLPSRLHISETAPYIRALGQAWQCKIGTKVTPGLLLPVQTFLYQEN